MRPQDIKQLIENHMKESKAIVESDDDTHFQAVVISPEFADKNRVEKQQAVYAALGNHITDGTIHAISLKTFTPDEWQQLCDQMSQQHG